MGRIYVKNNEGKYNIYSTIVDNWLSEEWLTYDQLVDELCKEAVEEIKRKMASTLTDQPLMKVYPWNEAVEAIKEINSVFFDSAGEELEGEQHKL